LLSNYNIKYICTTPSNNISFSHIVKPYLIFSVSEIVPIPIGSISDFCLFIFAPELASYFSKTLKIHVMPSIHISIGGSVVECSPEL
jgi:hypothetical protein